MRDQFWNLGDNVISKPWSPIRHVMASSQSGNSTEAVAAICHRSSVFSAAPATSGSGAIGKQGVGHQLIRGGAVLVMETAQLHGTQQHLRGGVWLHKSPDQPQTVEHAMTSHEPHLHAADGGQQAKLFDQGHVDPRGKKAGTGDIDQVGDLLGRSIGRLIGSPCSATASGTDSAA